MDNNNNNTQLAEMLAELTPLVAEFSASDQTFNIQTTVSCGYFMLELRFQKHKFDGIRHELVCDLSNYDTKSQRLKRIRLFRRKIVELYDYEKQQ